MRERFTFQKLFRPFLLAASFLLAAVCFFYYYRVSADKSLIYACLFYVPIVFAGFFYALRGGAWGAAVASVFCGWSVRADIGLQGTDLLLQLGSFYVVGLAIGFLRKRGVFYRKELESRLTRQVRVNEIGSALASSLELEEVLRIVIEKVTEALNCGIGSIMLVDPVSKEMRIAASHGLHKDVVENTKVKVGEGISGWVSERGEAVISQDVERDTRFASKQRSIYYNKSFISAPLKVKNKVIGVINVNNKHSHEEFTREDLELLVGIASQAAVALENARLYEHLRGVSVTATGALAEAIDARDHYTRHHSENVTYYAVAIAKQMGLPEKTVEQIRQASQLHDLGKIGVRDGVLRKSGMLTDEEWAEIKEHPVKGVQILAPLPFFNDLVPLVRGHHERYDGNGYPDGKQGRECPLGARIMAVADAYDAMTTTRPYRDAMSSEAAKKELVRGKGKHFDPEIVDVFFLILEKESARRGTRAGDSIAYRETARGMDS